MKTAPTNTNATAPAATDRISELVTLVDGLARNWNTANEEKGDSRARARARVTDAATVVLASLITDGGAWYRSARVSVTVSRKDRGEKVTAKETHPADAVLRAIVSGAPIAGTTRLA